MEAQIKGNNQVTVKPVPKQNAPDAALIKAPKLPKRDRDEPRRSDATDSQFAAPNPNRPKPKQSTPQIPARPQPQQLNPRQIRSRFSSIRSLKRRKMGTGREDMLQLRTTLSSTEANLNWTRSKAFHPERTRAPKHQTHHTRSGKRAELNLSSD